MHIHTAHNKLKMTMISPLRETGFCATIRMNLFSVWSLFASCSVEAISLTMCKTLLLQWDMCFKVKNRQI